MCRVEKAFSGDPFAPVESREEFVFLQTSKRLLIVRTRDGSSLLFRDVSEPASSKPSRPSKKKRAVASTPYVDTNLPRMPRMSPRLASQEPLDPLYSLEKIRSESVLHHVLNASSSILK